MIGFAVKKAFFDFWDHLVAIVLMNFGFVVLFSSAVFAVERLAGLSVAAAGAAAAVAVFALAIYFGAVATATCENADYRSLSVSDFFAALPRVVLPALVFIGIYASLSVVVAVGAPLYAGFGSPIGVVALAGVIWVAAVWVLASVLYFSVWARLEQRIGALLKKSVLLVFDNPMFTLGTAVVAVLIVFLSLPFAFLLPGPAGSMQWIQSSVKLRLLKYDYLERNPSADRRRIPWSAILVDERARVGPRSLKSTLFPWKE